MTFGLPDGSTIAVIGLLIAATVTVSRCAYYGGQAAKNDDPVAEVQSTIKSIAAGLVTIVFGVLFIIQLCTVLGRINENTVEQQATTVNHTEQ